MRTYCVLDNDDIGSVTFAEVCETSADTVRKTNTSDKFIVKWNGAEADEPASVAALAKISYNGRDFHTIQELKADVLSNAEFIPAE